MIKSYVKDFYFKKTQNNLNSKIRKEGRREGSKGRREEGKGKEKKGKERKIICLDIN